MGSRFIDCADCNRGGNGHVWNAIPGMRIQSLMATLEISEAVERREARKARRVAKCQAR